MLFRGTLLTDVLTGTSLEDTLYGGGTETVPLDLSDTVLGGSGNDLIYGNGGDDLLLGQADSDTAYGGVGDDSLYGGSSQTDTSDGSDALYAGVGSDWLYGNAGNDTLHGGDGTDTVYGGLGNDLIYADNSARSSLDGADWVAGGAGSDMIYGGAGGDSIFGGNGINDRLDAADTIDGGEGSDILYGNGGDDSLTGGLGNDTIFGGAGADTIIGGEGVDTIVADSSDVIYGGVGIDRFILQASTLNTQAATDNSAIQQLQIKDLEAGEFLEIKNLGGRNPTLGTDANGNAIIMVDGQTFATLEDINASQLIPVTNSNNTQIGFTVTSNTNSGSSGGGPAPNIAPTLIDLDNVTFLENTVNASAQVIDATVTFDDTDSANFDGGNLTVTYSAGGGVEDSLSVRNEGNGAGQIGVAGATISYAGTAIGTITTNGANGANLVITLNTNATPTAVDALIQNLTYANSSNTPTANRTISITANDGDGGTSAAATSIITVTAEAENAAPTLTNLDNVTFLENTVNASAQIIDATVTFDDTDSANFDGGNLTVTYSAGGGVEDSLSVRNQGVGGGQIGVAGADITYAGTIIGTITTNGTAGANLVITFNTNATPTAVDALIQNLTYANNSNTPAASRTISITANDGDGGTSAAATSVITVTAEAEAAPVIVLSSLNGTTGFRLDGAALYDVFGISVASAGDVNGDGFEDMILGAYQADPNGAASGSSYIVFGAAGGFAASINVNTLNGTNGFRLDGTVANGYAGYSVASAGDVNGDGFDDVIVGEEYASPNGHYSGSSYVVFGAAGGFAANINLNTLNGSNGFRLDGVAASDRSGRSVASAGDVNGDGFDDVIVGAWQADPNGLSSGSSYVVFGAAGGFAANINLSSLNGTTGFRLDGVTASDHSGRSIASAGDVNGDGFADVIVGASLADPNGLSSGSSYVVFGAAGGFAASINLSSLNGTNGFRLDGVAASDQSGISVASAGDVNGDGFDDLIVGAYSADPNGGYSGSSYVVFGAAGGFAANINLSSLNGTTGFRLDGVAASDRSGRSVASAGDVNGDGFDDVIVGAWQADPNGLSSGSSYVVFGAAGGFAANINLSSLNGTNGFRLDGIDAGDLSGASVASAGDVNGDGFDDLIIGAGSADPNGTFLGSSYIIYGNNDSGAATAVGTSGADTISGTMAADVIVAGLGNDVVTGDNGNDVIKGANGNDDLSGNAGTDKLFGGNGADTLIGGAGLDTLTGGDGIDRFTFTAITDSATGTPDVITDFNASATDLLVFSGLLTGAFSFVGAHGNAFAGGGNSSARFNDTTKLLEIDTDGNAAADMSITLKGVELANLSAADFSWS